MDFFERQEKARKTTAWLIMVYSAFVVAIVLAIHAIVSVAAFVIINNQDHPDQNQLKVEFDAIALNPTLILASLAIVTGIILVGTLVKIVALSQGGSTVAESMGGRQILPTTHDYQERRLLNIVEEMALASGVQMPRVYVLDQEPGINAFAAGFSSKDAAVAVTRGSLDLFNRDELQAVVGHEFSHILNGDMRLNIRMISVLSGILFIALMGTIILRIGSSIARSGRSSRKGKDNGAAIGFGLMVFGAAVWLIGSIGVLCARIMQAMISRQRELLADASSVQFTRNPSGMANALKIIGASASGSVLSNAHASEVSHMLFASGLKMNLFATHPRLEDRIRTIEPTFDGKFDDATRTIQQRRARRVTPAEVNDEDDLHESILAGAAVLHPGLSSESWQSGNSTPGAAATPRPPQPPRGKVPTPPSDQTVKDGWLSETEREALKTILGAQSCLCAAITSDNLLIQAKQRRIFTEVADSDFANRVDVWRISLAKLSMKMRRITCGMAINTLRVLPENELKKMLGVLDSLVSVDGQIDSLEFALTRMFKSRLLPDVMNSRRTATSAPTLSTPAGYCLNVLATFGSPDRDTVAAAWKAGIKKLTSFGDIQDQHLTNSTDLVRFDEALRALVRLPPMAKREFMEACEAVAQYDGTLTDIEDNFLFAIADVIEATGYGSVGV